MSPPDVVLDDVPTTLDLPNFGHVGVVRRYDLVSRHRKGRLSPWTRFASLNDSSSLRFSRSWLFTLGETGAFAMLILTTGFIR